MRSLDATTGRRCHFSISAEGSCCRTSVSASALLKASTLRGNACDKAWMADARKRSGMR